MLKAFKFLLIPVLGIFLFFLGLNVDYISASSLEDGLVGYYPFNGNADDESGNENHGFVYGATLIEDKFGNIGSAYNFVRITDASGDYIRLPVNINLNSMSQITIVAWAKINSEHLEAGQAVISNDNYGWDRAILNWYDDGWGIVDGAGLTGYHPVSLNEWYFLVGIYNHETGLVRLQVNNTVYEGSGYPGIGSTITNIGRTSHNTAYFDGSIDEVRIYNRVLSEEEIDELRNYFNSPPQPEDFSFIHMTDPHIGDSWIPGHKWYEELSYPRFTDGLYEIGKLEERPDFILMGGDLVEHAKSRWLEDYQSMVNSFTAQTSIPVYAVPGNHDRYSKPTGSVFCKWTGVNNCDDGLAEYKKQINIPGQGLGESNYLNPGNPLDYKFTHKGIQFIGLDSGADYIPDFEIRDLLCKAYNDKGIEGDGLTNDQMSALEKLNSEIPKVVFMHHPVLSGGKDYCDDAKCPREVLEDASFVDNYDEFFNWATSSNLQLALTGHTHRAEVYDEYDYQYDSVASAENRPLFIQTQSATHDGSIGHGYRLIDVENGAVNPRDASSTKEYIKLISQLDIEDEHELRVYDPTDNDNLEYITPDDTDGFVIPFFAASESKKVLLYGPESNHAKTQIWQENFSDNNFYFYTKIEGITLDDIDYKNDFGYRIGSILNRQFIHFHLENKSASIEAKNISFEDSNGYQFKVDWDELIETENIGNLEVMNNFNNGSGEILSLEKLKYSIIAKLFSPAELVVINAKTGSSTGIVNHESMEEINYSLSDEERERVLVYFKDGFANEEFIYRVQGLEDIYGLGKDEYSLRIVLKIDGEITEEVNIIDMPINASMTYQFYVDWDNLSDTEGVIMEIDKDGDGVFEIKIEMGRESNCENNYCLRIKMISDLEIAKIGEEVIDEKIDFIIGLIDKSLNQEWWGNDYYLNEKLGDNVFKTDLITARKLRLFLGLDRVFNNKKYIPEFIKSKFRLPSDVKEVFESVLDGLLNSDITLARIAVDNFPQNSDLKKDKKILETAEKKLERADELLPYKKIQVVQFCRQAWRMVN